MKRFRHRGPRVRSVLLLVAAFVALFVLPACEGCKSPKLTAPETKSDETPAARLIIVSDLAGALEPCGCVKDQLGGMDRFGALLGRETPKAKATGVLAAGPTFFMDMEIGDDKRGQEIAKATTIAGALKALGLLAFAPARNEWAAGAEILTKLQAESGAAMLAANVTSTPSAARWTTRELGGLEIGLIGVAEPDKAKVALEGATSTAPADAVRAGVEALKKEGVDAIVVLAAVGRGEAKRIADVSPELLAIVVGENGANGDTNTKAPPVERVGDVLILQTANHLQTVGVLDLYVRQKEGAGPKVFADATGIERMRKQDELNARIADLRARIATWETDKTVAKGDIAARRADVAKLEEERAKLDASPPPAEGNFYRYASREVREDAGVDADVKAQILKYYKYVNEHNKIAFAERTPKAPSRGEPRYVGVAECATCHPGARAFWDKTPHARAYATLSSQFKEFNLDCVGCHVTGYDRPGGSTVTHVEGLTDVQCEVCHGPGELHAKNPDKTKMPVARPASDTCLACHHPPHVHTFDALAKMNEILGPGHGRPLAPR